MQDGALHGRLGGSSNKSDRNGGRVSRLDDDLSRLHMLIDEGALVDGAGLLGVELELHLIEEDARPAFANAEVLAHLERSDLDVQSELARFNLEVNLPPVPLDTQPLRELGRRLDHARHAASAVVEGVTAVSIGTLPTLEPSDVSAAALSDKGRYREIDARIMHARGGSIGLAIDGTRAGGEQLDVSLSSIALEAAATSLQIHLDLAADGFPSAWNVAQSVAAVQVAVAANAPMLLGRRLWHESRVPLFEQLIDVRTSGQRATDCSTPPPRVWFGHDWITHPADLFTENLTYFRTPLVALEEHTEGQDPDALHALVRHNGTVWRWNRPVYAHDDGRPTLRIENRVLSAPPTTADAVADTALFIGLVAGLRADADRLTQELPFALANTNFRAAAEFGLAAPLHWPGVHGPVTAGELLVDHLIETAATGLDALGVPASESGPALDVIAGRASEGRNGAAWQFATLAEEDVQHDRRTALQRMLLRYRDLQNEGEPVHRWPWPGGTSRRSDTR